MRSLKYHDFIECPNNGDDDCKCIDCEGISACSKCYCMNDELLTYCPEVELDTESRSAILTGKVVDMFYSRRNGIMNRRRNTK